MKIKFKYNTGLGLSGLLLLSLIIRLLFLGRAELWQDEIGFLNIATISKSSWKVFLDYWFYSAHFGQLPLTGVLQSLYDHAVQPWIGDIEKNTFWLRLPAVLFGVFAVFASFRLAVLLSGRAVGWSVAWIMTLFFYPVFYSRELYCYSAVICFSAYGLYYYARIAWRGDASRRAFLGLFVSLSGLVLSHYSGSMLVVAMGAASGVRWVYGLLSHKETAARNPPFRAGLGCVLAFMTALPYWIHLFTADNVLSVWSSPLSIPVIWNDVVSKFLFGEIPAMAVLSWILLLVGGVAFLSKKGRFAERIEYLLIFILAFGLLTYGVKQSQYLSARYFSPVVAMVYVFLAEGFWVPSRLMCRSPRIAKAICLTITVAACCVHLFYFLPPYYRLTAKSVDFGVIAKWLNKNLKPGQPYLMESAYELRWVGGYYTTPELTGASPYVHGGGPGEVERLHESQQKFIQSFPEAPFVESAHHNWEKPEGVWKWPRQFHAQHIQLRNEPLRALIRLGIYPGTPHEAITDYSFITDIYYSTPDDIAQRARERGAAAIFRWVGWNCAPYTQDPRTRVVEYGWAASGATGKLSLQNLGSAAVKGRIRLDMAIAAPPGAVDVYLRLPSSTPVTFRRSAGQFQTVETPEFELPSGVLNVEIGVLGARASSVQGMLIRDAQFVQLEGKP